MNKIIIFLLIIYFFKIYSQENTVDEVWFNNETNQTIYIRIYPVSFVFNHYHNYDMKSVAANQYFTYINGRIIGQEFLTLTPTNQPGWSHEHEGTYGSNGNIGYGDYKIEFSTNNTFTNIIDSLIVQYDWMNTITEEMMDLQITFRNSTNDGTNYFTYDWRGPCPESTFPSNRKIQH